VFTCKIGGKKLKMVNGLDRHTSGAHWRSKVEGAPVSNNHEATETSPHNPAEKSQLDWF